MKTELRKQAVTATLLLCGVLLAACDATAAAAELPPFDGAAAMNAEGMERLHAGDFGSAERLFAGSVSRNPEVKHYYNNLAVSLMRQGKYDKAYGPLKRAVSMDPSYARALSNLAIVCFHLSRFREAYACYVRARSADREYADGRFEKTRVLRKIEELQRNAPGNGNYIRIYEHLQSLDGEGVNSIRKTD